MVNIYLRFQKNDNFICKILLKSRMLDVKNYINHIYKEYLVTHKY